MSSAVFISAFAFDSASFNRLTSASSSISLSDFSRPKNALMWLHSVSLSIRLHPFNFFDAAAIERNAVLFLNLPRGIIIELTLNVSSTSSAGTNSSMISSIKPNSAASTAVNHVSSYIIDLKRSFGKPVRAAYVSNKTSSTALRPVIRFCNSSLV